MYHAKIPLLEKVINHHVSQESSFFLCTFKVLLNAVTFSYTYVTFEEAVKFNHEETAVQHKTEGCPAKREFHGADAMGEQRGNLLHSAPNCMT